jgi:Ca2+-binding RTX toxin-like protein
MTGAIALALLLLPACADATIWLQGATSRIYVSAPGPGADDEVTVSGEGEGAAAVYVFTDPVGITATSPCVLRSPTEGTCPAPERSSMTVELGNGRNRFAARLHGLPADFSLRQVWVTSGRGRDVLDLRGLPPGLPFAQALSGRGGDTIIAGPATIDRMNGAFGDDRLIGSAGRDVQRGGPGADLLIGRGGPDLQTGGSGRDRLRGGGGHDYIDAGAGADLLDGGAAFDVLLGGAGFDRALPPVTGPEERKARSIEAYPARKE